MQTICRAANPHPAPKVLVPPLNLSPRGGFLKSAASRAARHDNAIKLAQTHRPADIIAALSLNCVVPEMLVCMETTSSANQRPPSRRAMGAGFRAGLRLGQYFRSRGRGASRSLYRSSVAGIAQSGAGHHFDVEAPHAKPIAPEFAAIHWLAPHSCFCCGGGYLHLRALSLLPGHELRGRDHHRPCAGDYVIWGTLIAWIFLPRADSPLRSRRSGADLCGFGGPLVRPVARAAHFAALVLGYSAGVLFA